MAELTTIARPYAEAAFRIAEESRSFAGWSDMLSLAGAVVADPRVAGALDNPKLTTADKEALLLSVCGERIDPMGRNFIRVLVEAKRVSLLPQIAALFEGLRNDAEGRAGRADRNRVPAVRGAARGHHREPGKAFRQEDRRHRRSRCGTDRRRADHRGRHGDRRHGAGKAPGDGDPVARLISKSPWRRRASVPARHEEPTSCS